MSIWPLDFTLPVPRPTDVLTLKQPPSKYLQVNLFMVIASRDINFSRLKDIIANKPTLIEENVDNFFFGMFDYLILDGVTFAQPQFPSIMSLFCRRMGV